MRWFERPEILNYIIESYAGSETTPNGQPKRQFIWEQPSGDVVIGNSRAFSDHLAEKFSMIPNDHRWVAVHRALQELGEAVGSTELRGPRQHKYKTKNQQPELRVLKRRS